jgi:GNAT superfamily N-acetyltransferase
MTDGDVLPATADRFGDLATVINPTGNPRSCWCLAYRLTSRQVGELGDGAGGEREQHLRDLTAQTPSPGLLAYREGEPVGWVGLGPRRAVPRLARSRVIPHVDDLAVWSVFCLVVRSGWRRQGVTQQLLAGAEAYAVVHGAPALESYPVDPVGGRRVNSALAYVGTTGMFERAGYHRVQETSSKSDGMVRWLMRKDLQAGSSTPASS